MSIRALAFSLTILAGLLLGAPAFAQSQTRSPAAAGDCTNQGGIGTVAWSSTGNAISSDDGHALATVDGETTNYLRCLNYGFSIPVGATILGIEVNVERKSDRTSNGGSQDAAMRLVKAGAIQATDRSTVTVYTTVDQVETHGGAADLWGTTWTSAEINAANFGAAFAAIKPSANGPAHDITVDHIAITVYYTPPTTPGSFNAFETSTAAGATTGVIQTRVAGAPFSLDVVAILGGVQFAGFTNAVIVELLGNSALGVALDANNCPITFTTLQTVAPNPTISGGRSTVSFAAVANAWRDVRVRVRYPVASPTVTACSTDNFAIRPASFAIAVTDNDWQSAGTGRALTNTGAAGGTVHKAGRSFTITVTPAPGTATNYDGDPTVSALACTLPATCSNGALAVGAFSGTGIRTSNTATYSEAGAFNLTLVDQNFAAVDGADGTPADCTATGRYVCQSPAPLAVGRFVPDHFALAAVTQPVLRTFDVADAACLPPAAPARSFTYIGQPFGYATAPVATVLARNAAGGTTSNYRGTLWKLTAASAAQALANAPVLPLDTSQILAATLIETPNTGTGTLSANGADRIAFVRDNATASAPFTASLTLSWSVSDNSEAGAGQGTIATTAALGFNGGGPGIVFDSGAEFRYGRLRLGNANGSQLVPLPILMETQYWSGVAGFVTNAADHCTSIASGSVAMGTFTGNLAACETAVSNAGTLTSGRRTLLLAAPGNGNDGSVTLSANLGPAPSGTTCTVVGGAATPATGADRAYLRGNWTGAAYDDDPVARATFGAFRGSGEVIFMRENY